MVWILRKLSVFYPVALNHSVTMTGIAEGKISKRILKTVGLVTYLLILRKQGCGTSASRHLIRFPLLYGTLTSLSLGYSKGQRTIGNDGGNARSTDCPMLKFQSGGKVPVRRRLESNLSSSKIASLRYGSVDGCKRSRSIAIARLSKLALLGGVLRGRGGKFGGMGRCGYCRGILLARDHTLGIRN